MSEMKYSLEPETSKPDRRYRKGSKFDPILESFKDSSYTLVKVEVEGKDANYIRTQLKKRLDAQNIKNVVVSVVNDICYLEKVDSKKPRRKKGHDAEPEPSQDAEPEPSQDAEPEQTPQDQE